MSIPPEITTDELIDILGITIKHDDINKLVTFLCLLTASTEDSQLNLSFNAPSSSGKSFIPMEIAKYFPAEEVMELGYVSPTAFFHAAGEYDKEKNQYTVNLEGKILIFLDQPHTLLLEHLRPFLSHDKKEIKIQIADKTQKHGLRTKNVILRGYPVVVFCSAGLRMDEQEATRFLLLSPEVSHAKIRAGVVESLIKAADKDAYWDKTEINVPRQHLKGRVKAIRSSEITDVRITLEDQNYIIERFWSSIKTLKPRHQRDIKRLVAIIKALSLLNLWHRKNEGTRIVASRKDIDAGYVIWDKISLTQELNIPPYVYRLYEDVMVAAFNDKNHSEDNIGIGGKRLVGITRQEVLKKHYEVYGRMLDALTLRQQLIPALSQAGLISEENDPSDKRSKLIFPQLPIGYSELNGGLGIVEKEKNEIVKTVMEVFGEEAKVFNG